MTWTYEYAIDGQIHTIEADGFRYEGNDQRHAVFWEHYISADGNRREVFRCQVDERSVVRLDPAG